MEALGSGAASIPAPAGSRNLIYAPKPPNAIYAPKPVRRRSGDRHGGTEECLGGLLIAGLTQVGVTTRTVGSVSFRGNSTMSCRYGTRKKCYALCFRPES